MGEFEELRKVGTKLSRAAEIELQKKQQQIQYEEAQRKKQEESNRRRKEAETQKLLHQRRPIQAHHLQDPHHDPWMHSRQAAPLKRQEYTFEALQKMAQPNGGSSTKSQNGTYDRNRNGERDDRRSPAEGSSRQAAIERLKVTRGLSPERTLSSAQSYSGTKILKKPPVKRSSAPKSVFPNFRIPTKNVNHVRDAGLKALRDGPIALNTVKRDRRSVEEVTAELRETDTRREERAKKMKAIEEEKEKQRLHREKAFQAAKYQRALMSEDAHETERLHKEITGESKTSRKARSVSRSRSPSPRRRSRSRSPVRRRRSKSPPRKRRSVSPVSTKKRRYSPEARKRSLSPKRRRSVSPPPKRKLSRDLGDRERDRDRDQDRERDRERERAREREGDRDAKQSKGKTTNGSSKRRVSRSPSPRPKKRSGSPRASGRSRGPFEEDLSVSSVIAGLFGTRYRARVEDEDLSDDMEARPDEVFREEARSARIARQEDEKEAELERAQAERARKRKLEREKERGRS
ncbi:hypothetical protein KVV02_002416 [Mortierella alpina]|uniref:Uncharacterized protein n=1 Tax=Mortierella alpina TaxID=64518 RepID=A0A9P7ZWJ4_MORAP|nr:hypothetical protein KVV02_002416 [Mortierella alpina]